MLLLAIPILIGLVMWLVGYQTRKRSELVQHTLLVEVSLERLMLDVQNADSTRRVYLGTGQQQFLDSYNTATEAVQKEFANLSALTADNPRHVQDLGKIRSLLERAFERLPSDQVPGPEAVPQPNLLNSIQTLAGEMYQEEQRHLSEHESALTSANRQFAWALFVGYGLIVLIVGSLYRSARQHSLETAEAQGKLTRLNAELDERVRQRTALLHAREEQLQESEQRLRALAGSLLTAQEDERRNLARELHDDVTQQLAFLSIELGRLARELPRATEAHQRALTLQAQTTRASSEVRRISHGLHPSVITDFGLGIALEEFCTEFQTAHKIHVEFEGLIEDSSLNDDAATSLYRVAQESLRNARIHGHAKNISVTLSVDNGLLHLQVSDDGIGFSMDSSRSKAGLGITSMSERIRLVHGTLTLSPRPGGGTIVTASIPLTGGVNAAAQDSARR